MKGITGKTVLITGGTGSFGKAIVDRLVKSKDAEWDSYLLMQKVLVAESQEKPLP